MTDVAVIIRAARDSQTVSCGDSQIVRGHGRIVIAVIGLDRLQSLFGEMGDELVTAKQTRMGERRNASRLVNDVEHIGRSAPTPGHVRRLPLGEQLIKRFPDVRHMARLHQRPCDHGTAHRASGFRDRRFRQTLDIDRLSQSLQLGGHLLDAPHSIGTLSLKERSEYGAFRIEEIPEHMDVPLAEDRRNLDAGDALDPVGAGRRGDLRESRNGVVVGHTEHVDAGAPGPPHELGGFAAPVGRGCMEMKVDQLPDDAWRVRSRRPATRATLREPADRVGGLTSARYSLLSRSKCAFSSSANSRKICFPSESSKRSP